MTRYKCDLLLHFILFIYIAHILPSTVSTKMEPNFSNEIWLEVFSHLNYFELKNCMRVSKTFKAFTHNAAFDNELFRSHTVIPANGDIDVDDVETHPALDMLMCFECATDIKDVYLGDFSDEDDNCRIDKCSAASEHITSPPLALICFQIHRWRPIEVKNKDGVTVLQFMDALCRYFAKSLRGGGIRRDMMGDHTGWHEFSKTLLDKKGRVVLRADSLDS